jgi:protein gp37
MARESEISWTDATFNPVIGCTKVGPGCDHCYAARDNERRHWVSGWGAERRRTSAGNWNQVRRWNREAAITGKPLRVFCASLADVFDNEWDPQWREDLWALLRETPNLRWILLTKRIGNVMKMVPADWPFPHVGIMATMVNQAEYDRDRLKLSDIPAPWRGISAEPLLGRIILDHKDAKENLHWMITGGESGPVRRPLDLDAVRYLRDQCRELGIAFHHKQNGGLRGKDNGCLVDGVEHKAFPEALAA